MFTVLFALRAGLPGWIAHWREMHGEPNKIGRPRQIYTGYGERDYVLLDGPVESPPSRRQGEEPTTAADAPSCITPRG